MAIQDQINRITNEVGTQSDLIEQIKNALQGKASSGGSGSGIIDVTELPTVDIDENATYRITTQIEDPPLDLWVVMPNGVVSLRTEIAEGMEWEIHIVSELPDDMDVINSNIIPIYIIDSTGVAYINVVDIGVVSLSLMMFGEAGLDKGWTDDPYSIDFSNPENYGIYATRPVLKDFIRLYFYKNSQWNELTAHINYSGRLISISGEYSVGDIIEVKKASETVNIPEYVMDNKSLPMVIVDAPSTASLIIGNVTEITKDFFGDYYEGIGNIRDYAFCEQHRLESIELPDSIVQIGNYAFQGCSDLICEALPPNVEHIGHHAFSGCTKLALSSLPVGLEYIEFYSFNNCTNLALTEINLKPRSSGDISQIGQGAFHQCINMPLAKITCDNLNYIGAYAFFNCQKLILTELPNTIEEIGNEAFAHCSQLKLTKFPRNLINIGISAFSECDSLTQIALPESIETIDSSAFNHCSELRQVTICSDRFALPTDWNPAKYNISPYAFQQCPKLVILQVPWGKDDVPGAPWGATNATIFYDSPPRWDTWEPIL